MRSWRDSGGYRLHNEHISSRVAIGHTLLTLCPIPSRARRDPPPGQGPGDLEHPVSDYDLIDRGFRSRSLPPWSNFPRPPKASWGTGAPQPLLAGLLGGQPF